MATNQTGAMRLDDFYRLYMQPRGFVLERDHGPHARIYRHVQTGIMLSVGCDEGDRRMSPNRVDAARKDVETAMARIRDVLLVRGAPEPEPEETHRVCIRCGVDKPLHNYAMQPDKNGGMTTNRRKVCQSCVNQAIAEGIARRAAEQAKEQSPAFATASPTFIPSHAPSIEPPQPNGSPAVAEPLTTPQPAMDAAPRDTLTLAEFFALTASPEHAAPTAFLSLSSRYIVTAVAGSYYLLTTDGGPGATLSEQSITYIVRLLSRDAPLSSLVGVLFY